LQLKLLEKIEELTLYTLEQEQRLQEMEILKGKLAAIEATVSDRHNCQPNSK
jgi:hypothetical protein